MARATVSPIRKLYTSLCDSIRRAGRLDLLVFPLGTAPVPPDRRCLISTDRPCWRPRGYGHGGMYCERHGKPGAPGWLTFVKAR